MLTQERVRELFDYDPEVGHLVWKERPRSDFRTDGGWKMWNARYPGTTDAGTDPNGYRRMMIEGATRYSHRLIWLYVHGELPKHIDHVNGDPSDNRLSNLRNVSMAENMRNKRMDKRNKHGHTGISFEYGKWRASIRVDNRLVSLGSYHTIDEAISVRDDAEVKYGFHPNHGRAA